MIGEYESIRILIDIRPLLLWRFLRFDTARIALLRAFAELGRLYLRYKIA